MNIENPITKTTENIIEEENTLKGKMKFIAMNRFKIVPNREKDFENIWKNRETNLNDVSGFIEFHLVKGNSEETHTVYASHSTWNSRKDFESWTKSEAFRAVFILGIQNLKVLKLLFRTSKVSIRT